MLSSSVAKQLHQIPKCVLLTGATGFLGAFLLEELLIANSVAKVYCAVRAKDNEEALSRLRSTLELYKIKLQPEQWSRVHAIVADLSLPHFGWSDEQWEELSQEIESVIHNAAMVYSLKPYNFFKSHNVDATRELLRFCCTSRIKQFHFVSTISTCAPKSKTELVIEENAGIAPIAAMRYSDGYKSVLPFHLSFRKTHSCSTSTG